MMWPLAVPPEVTHFGAYHSPPRSFSLEGEDNPILVEDPDLIRVPRALGKTWPEATNFLVIKTEGENLVMKWLRARLTAGWWAEANEKSAPSCSFAWSRDHERGALARENCAIKRLLPPMYFPFTCFMVDNNWMFQKRGAANRVCVTPS